MSGFSESWLGLREPADLRARDAALAARAAALVQAKEGGDPARIVDLGCGTGSTLQALHGQVPGADWLLVDNDAALLSAALRRAEALVAQARALEADLTDLAAIPFDGVRLVTASALFDLAAGDFVDALAERLSTAGAGLYAALNYDGSKEFEPSHPLDGVVMAAFNRHQVQAKGLGGGRALGPAAVSHLTRGFEARGYAVEIAESPWRLGPAETALASAHIAGMADAVAELDVLDRAELEGWRQARLTMAAATTTIVGHLDLLARPG